MGPVERGHGLIQQQDLLLSGKAGREQKHLALAAGEIRAALDQARVVAHGKHRNYLVEPGRTGGSLNALPTRACRVEIQVPPDAASDELRELWEIEQVGLGLLGATPAHEHLTPFGRNQARQDAEDGALPEARSTFDPRLLARGHPEVQPLHHPWPLGVVTEPDILRDDPTGLLDRRRDLLRCGFLKVKKLFCEPKPGAQAEIGHPHLRQDLSLRQDGRPKEEAGQDAAERHPSISRLPYPHNQAGRSESPKHQLGDQCLNHLDAISPGGKPELAAEDGRPPPLGLNLQPRGLDGANSRQQVREGQGGLRFGRGRVQLGLGHLSAHDPTDKEEERKGSHSHHAYYRGHHHQSCGLDQSRDDRH